MPINHLLPPELESVLVSLLETCGEIYLIGGVIRDCLLKNESKDIDFVVKQNALTAARRVADQFNGDFYVLDQRRGTGRALIKINEEPLTVDFATINGGSIHEDLKLRDFTINAIAQDVNGSGEFIDPLNGIADLENSQLNPCSPFSFSLDPVRTIRAVRFMLGFNLEISASTKELLKESTSLLEEVSAERKRDEIFHVFEAGRIEKSMEVMRDFNLWDELFPLLKGLEKIEINPPHVHNGLKHTLRVAACMQAFLTYIRSGKIEPDCGIRQSGFEMLDEFRKDLDACLDTRIHPDRKYDGLLYLMALYHDIGKTKLTPLKEGNIVLYPGHANVSVKMFHDLAPRWTLSNDENRFIEKMIGNHMPPRDITDTVSVESRQSLYRFYQRTGSAGIWISIFHLSDITAAYEDTLTDERWQSALQTSHALLESWFRKHAQIIQPPILFTGEDLMHELDLKSGKFLGEVLGKLREMQAGGVILDKQSALQMAHKLVEKKEQSYP